MFDQLTLDFFIALYSLFTVTTFTIISLKRKQLFSWLPALFSLVIGSFCILFQFQDPILRFIGNIFYLISVILFVAIIFHDYLDAESLNLLNRKSILLCLPIIGSFFVIGILPSVTILIRIQICVLILLAIAMGLFLRVYLIKKTPTNAFMFLTSISVFFTSFTTLGSFFYSFIFWEFSYLGNIVFLTLILTTSFVALLEDRLKKSVNNYQEAYENLKVSEKRYRTLYQTIKVGLISTDLNGVILTVNKASTKLFGYKNIAEVIGTNVSDHFEDPQECKNLRFQLLQNGFVDNFTLPVKKQDGTTIIVEIGSNLHKDETKNKIRIETVLRDITEYKKAEFIRKKLEEKRESFVSLTQHELRTPLTIGLGWCEYLLKKNMSDENDEKIVQKIRKSLLRLERLVGNVRTSVQLEENFFQIDKQQIDICSFMTEKFTHYQHCLGEVFQFKGCPEDILTLKGDKAKLKQVIENLMDNAIKQTSKDNRQIVAEIKTQADNFILSIHDNGAGISSIDLERIFNKNVSIPTDNSIAGTGLGLYLVQEILKSHGGSIIAESEGIGQGSTFTITLQCNSNPKVCNSALLSKKTNRPLSAIQPVI